MIMFYRAIVRNKEDGSTYRDFIVIQPAWTDDKEVMIIEVKRKIIIHLTQNEMNDVYIEVEEIKLSGQGVAETTTWQ